MSTRGTLRIEDVEGRVVWAYISSDAGAYAKSRIEKAGRWVAKQKRSPSAEAVLKHLLTLAGAKGYFHPTPHPSHPFSDENLDPEFRQIYRGGESSPFNEYEYHAQVTGSSGRWRLEVVEVDLTVHRLRTEG